MVANTNVTHKLLPSRPLVHSQIYGIGEFNSLHPNVGVTMAKRTKKFSIEQLATAETAIEQLEVSVKFLVTDFTVEFLVDKVREEEYFVPEYQRKFVWKAETQSRFIESVLIGLPIPFLFLWQADDGRLEIVDGSQRLRTLTRFMDGELRLKDLQLLEPLEGFSFRELTKIRQRKFGSRVIRGIVLDNSVGEATRTEMFNRVNTGGTKANEAEVRRGVLPGPMSDLVKWAAEDATFKRLTPIPKRQVEAREREELAVRFFTFLDSATVDDENVTFPGWQDRPRDYIYNFVKTANFRGLENPQFIETLRHDFSLTLDFIEANFPNGFRKTSQATQVPRVRFEAIAVATGLALRSRPELVGQNIDVSPWINSDEFQEVTTSDAANVRSKLQRRISYVYSKLVAQ